MADGLIILFVLGIVLSLVLFVLVVRFLWVVPTSLRSIANCLWSHYDTLDNDENDDEKDNF